MPTPLGEAALMRYPPLSDLGGEHRAKPVPPKSDGLMADLDPALGQEILDVAQRQRVPHVHHHDQTDHFWRAVEISKRIAHGLKLPQPEAARKIALTPPHLSRPRLPGEALVLRASSAGLGPFVRRRGSRNPPLPKAGERDRASQAWRGRSFSSKRLDSRLPWLDCDVPGA